MKRKLALLFILLGLTSQLLGQTTNRSFAGTWQGTLDAGQKLRLALVIQKAADGSYSAKVDSLDQGASIPVEVVTVNADAIHLELKSVGAIFEGKLNADGSELSGQFSQGGTALPLAFTRSAAVTTATPKPAASSAPVRATVAPPVPVQREDPPGINIDRVIAELEPEIQRALVTGRIPSAAIALISGDRVIWSGAYGYSNLWARTPATANTTYLIGSTFKAMSTIALLQQMEQGKFKLDDRVNDYLTEFKIQGEDPQHPVTFRHLLTHTSGLPGDFGPFPVWGDTVPPKLEEYLSKSLKVDKAPMTAVVYSNMAYTLIGYLVQKFSGVPYKQYIQEHIFGPLEMTSTAFEPTPEMEERLSIPYTVDEKTGGQMATVRLKASVWPAGLVYGTVLNQANWLIANLNGGVFKGKRLLSEQTFEQMCTRQYDQFKGGIEGIWGNETAGFGLTWWVQVRDGDRYLAHSGSVPGYTAFLLGNRDRKLGFAILTNGNRAHPHLFKLADRAIDLLKKYSTREKSGANVRQRSWRTPHAPYQPNPVHAG